MKVLFLDMDGVLNSTRFLAKKFLRLKRDLDWPYDYVDKQAVLLLNEIVERAGCKVVLSSSWRILCDEKEITEILSKFGFKYTVIDTTPRSRLQRMRGEEIQEWIDLYNYNENKLQQVLGVPGDPVEKFCIVDDASDMAHLCNRLVQTNVKKGLQRQHVERIVEMLK